MSSQSFVNVVIPFAPDRADGVDGAIQALADPACGNRPGASSRKQLHCIPSLHFMSIIVARPTCPAENDGSACPQPKANEKAHLLMELSADGGAEAVLAELAEWFAPSLMSIFDEAGLAYDQGLLKVLLQYRVEIADTWPTWDFRPALGQVFSGSPGMSAERIRRERRLARHLRNAVTALHGSFMSPRQKLDYLRDKLWSDPKRSWKWAFVPEPAPLLGASPDPSRSVFNPQIRKAAASIFGKLLGRLVLPLAVVVLLSVIAAWMRDGPFVALAWIWAFGWLLIAVSALVLLFALGRLRKLEQTDSVENTMPSLKHGEDLLAVENFTEQNHLASVSRLKPGLLRRLTLRIAFLVVGTGRFVCAPGFLGRNGVIHFARWMRLPGTDQLVFWSNYDGTWESYVADFIADAPTGVTAIWSNCVGFPRTRGLFGGGAADRDRLVMWARRQQLPTRFWYSAYRNLTAARVRTNAAIRQGFASAESFQDCQDWLSLFGSAPRPAATLQVPEITTIAFGGLSMLRWSACVGFTFANTAAPANKAFLEAIRGDVTYGEAIYGADTAMVLGLSARGLGRLGIPQDALETFPVAFKQGMWEESRARLLKDTGPHAPDAWAWGGAASQVDVFLSIYALDDDNLRTLVDKVLAAASDNGVAPVFVQPLTLLRDRADPQSGGVFGSEPFGFTDGVSQPIIRGAPGRNRRQEAEIQVVEAGEFIYGYPDNLGVIPPAPSIVASLDPQRLLPDAEANPFRQRPEFSSYEGQGRRDLGMNGTYLVVRQLEQHVEAFEEWFRDEAVKQLEKHVSMLGLGSVLRLQFVGSAAYPALAAQLTKAKDLLQARDTPEHEDLKEAVRAKMMGRWKDGSSLVRQSRPPGPPGRPREADNDFLFGVEDPAGLSCPFGAHVRRANPRDTRFPGSEEEIASTNRHRLLRVGRVYGKLADGDKRQSMERGTPQGLMFMCLNIDIERQFEFVQKTWILNPSIHGLENESDPILGHGDHRRFTIPTSSGPVCLRKLPEFTRVMGGGYFFVPSRSLLRFLALPAPEDAMATPRPAPAQDDKGTGAQFDDTTGSEFTVAESG